MAKTYKNEEIREIVSKEGIEALMDDLGQVVPIQPGDTFRDPYGSWTVKDVDDSDGMIYAVDAKRVKSGVICEVPIGWAAYWSQMGDCEPYADSLEERCIPFFLYLTE